MTLPAFDPNTLLTVPTLLTLVGNAVVVMLLVELVKRTAALTDAQVTRFGPLLAIVAGVGLALAAGVYLGRPLPDAALLGFVSGCVASGLYAAIGEQIGKVVETLSGGRLT